MKIEFYAAKQLDESMEKGDTEAEILDGDGEVADEGSEEKNTSL